MHTLYDTVYVQLHKISSSKDKRITLPVYKQGRNTKAEKNGRVPYFTYVSVILNSKREQNSFCRIFRSNSCEEFCTQLRRHSCAGQKKDILRHVRTHVICLKNNAPKGSPINGEMSQNKKPKNERISTKETTMSNEASKG